MNDDPIVGAVRQVREQLAAKFNYDVHAIFADMRAREKQIGERLIRHPKKPNRVSHSSDSAVHEKAASLPAAG
jgi:hypothetical protein